MNANLPKATNEEIATVTSIDDSKELINIGFPKFEIKYLWRNNVLYKCKDYWKDKIPGDIPAWSFLYSMTPVIDNYHNLFKSYIDLINQNMPIIMKIQHNIYMQLIVSGIFKRPIDETYLDDIDKEFDEISSKNK
jgi:hypothetical protein